MSEEGKPSEVARAMQAEREAAEKVAEARREAADMLSRARRNARHIRARGEALVKRMSLLVSQRREQEVSRIQKERGAELSRLEEAEVSGPAYRKAAASVAAGLLGFEDTPQAEDN
ncbi:MAG: hypothetical protein ACLFWF_14210 [Alphaproteobacteria bacterium]